MLCKALHNAFRTLKTDLDLRPIYYKQEDVTVAHLNLRLLAYWVVNTIRFKLKRREEASPVVETINADNQQKETSINFFWKEIVHILNTQKAVTTTDQNNL